MGLLAGLLSSTEAQELAERYQSGKIDPAQQEAIADALARRYHAMQIRFGTDMARRGLTDSTIAARLQSGLMAREGQDLALALGQVSQQNKRMGMDMMAAQAQQRMGAIGQAASVVGNLHLADRQARMDREWLDIYRQSLSGTPPVTPASSQVAKKPVPGARQGGNDPLSGSSTLRNRQGKPGGSQARHRMELDATRGIKRPVGGRPMSYMMGLF